MHSVDATRSSRLGAFVNDSTPRYANCKMEKRYDKEKKPHLCLYARTTIKAGEELRYDYGANNLWWRKKE